MTRPQPRPQLEALKLWPRHISGAGVFLSHFAFARPKRALLR